MDYFYEKINKIYDQNGFLEKYGGSLVMTVIIILVFFVLISYFYVRTKMDTIKQNWPEERCKPSVIPFAGLINAPDDQNASDYTAQNFNDCMNTTLEGVADTAMQPLYYTVDLANQIINVIAEGLDAIRSMFDNLRNSITAFGQEIYARILNIIMPLIFVFVKMIDGFQKVNGVMGTAIFGLMGSYDTMSSLFQSVGDLIILILLIFVALIIVGFALSYNPLTVFIGAPMVLVNTILFLLISIPLILIEVYMTGLMPIHFNIPGLPTCFCGSVKLQKNDGTYINIKDLKIGDDLLNDGKITCIMKVSAYKQNLYKYDNIIVSGDHSVFNENEIILVKNDPRFKEICNEEKYLYCLGTEKHTISIDDVIFTDWFELKEHEWYHLNKMVNNSNKSNLIKDNYLGGFQENTLLELLDGESCPISKIKPNDILRFGERVKGIVKIDAKHLDVYNYELIDFKFQGRNIHICNKNLGVISSKNLNYTSKKGEKFLYHLITDKQFFHIEGNTILDFNSCIDLYLEEEQEKLYKILLSRDLL